MRKLFARKLLVTALLVLVLAVVTACSWSGSGEVVEKEHESAYTTLIWNGKSSTPVYHPECFELEIEELNGQTHELCVDEETWNRFDVGDPITITEEGEAS